MNVSVNYRVEVKFPLKDLENVDERRWLNAMVMTVMEIIKECIGGLLGSEATIKVTIVE